MNCVDVVGAELVAMTEEDERRRSEFASSRTPREVLEPLALATFRPLLVRTSTIIKETKASTTTKKSSVRGPRAVNRDAPGDITSTRASLIGLRMRSDRVKRSTVLVCVGPAAIR